MKYTTIAIADDSQMFRYLIKKILLDKDFLIDIEATNGKELIDKIEMAPSIPNICILDIGMPVMDGYSAIEILRKRWPSIKVLIFLQHYHNYAIGTMIRAGAKGFISKEENSQCLLEAIISINTQGYYCSDYVNKKMFQCMEKSQMDLPKFTSFEKRLIAILCTDMQYSDIAKKLFISKHTVEKHKQNISKKTGINSREGLMLFAIQNDLFNLDFSRI
jgi:two-component system invasion response regulator UvrY